MTSITFANPWWLLVTLLAIPVVLTGLLWFTTTMTRARAVSAVILRSVLLALIAAMLAGASAVQTSDRIAAIVVVDVSDSIRQFARSPNDDSEASVIRAAEAFIDAIAADPRRRPDDRLGVVVFDGLSIAVRMPTPRPLDSAPSDRRDLDIDVRFAEGTNIERALRFAAALFPPDAARRLVLVSDGNQTEGDALAAAREISASGAAGAPLPIDVVPVTYRSESEVFVEAVDAPPQASTESTIDVRVVLRATEPATGRLELLYEGDPVDLNGPDSPGSGLEVDLIKGHNPFRLPVELTGAVIHRFRAVFVPHDRSMDRVALNNSADAYTITPGKGSALVVDGVGAAAPSSPGRMLSRALAESDIDVQTISAAEFPIDLLALQAYDLVILQNVPAEDIPRPTHQLLADYVTQLGGGLIMVGGPDSLGAGGWNGTPLEDVLPVELDLPEQLLVPSAAISIVLDNSGSMGQSVLGGSRSKQEIANQAAALAIETLDATDLVSVIAFNSSFDVVIPMRRNESAARSANRVRSISTGGGTHMYPALNHAFQQLQQGEAANAHVRHIILLSDGQSQGSPQQGIDLALRMRNSDISISTIAVGDHADAETLRKIAVAGGGQFYEVIDPNSLPRIFIRDIRVVRKPLIRETPFQPVVTGSSSPITRDLPSRLPALEGLVLSQHRDDPKVARAINTPEGEPLLAHWFVGRGQAAVFASDAHHWARHWLRWPGYRTFWTQLARTIARPPTQRTSELTAEIDGDELIIRLDAADDSGAPLDLLTVTGTVFTPDQRRLEIRLEQISPGAYQTRLPVQARGNYVVALFPRQGDVALPGVVGAASRAVGVEFRRLRSDAALLQQIASATGGTIHDLAAPDEVDLFSRDGVEPVRAASPLWPALLIWSVVLLLLDVATRRVAWDRLLTRELVLEVREQAATAVQARGRRAAATVAALRSVSNKPERRQARPAPKAPLMDRAITAHRPVESSHADDARKVEQRKKVLERLGKGAGAAPPNESGPAPVPEKPLRDSGAGQRVRRSRPPEKQDSAADAPATSNPASEQSTTFGLLDAKRRARERRSGVNDASPTDDD